MTFWPQCPQMTPVLHFCTITYVEGLKLIHMYESYGHAMEHGHIIAFLVKMTFWTQWPQMTPDWHLTP